MSENSNRIVFPIGPQHPSLDEPGCFNITLQGEKVVDAVIGVGYVHRGIEKACESMTYIQDLYIIERVCGICSHAHSTAFCRSVEDLTGVTVPPRAEYIRVIIAELERLHSHLLWLGTACHEIGFDTMFMYTWRDREKVLDILAGVGGNRINYGVNAIGGVRRDFDETLSTELFKTLDVLEDQIKYYLQVASTESTLISRLSGVGKLSREDVIKYGAIGPVARAAGIGIDIRVTEPYGAYKEIPVNVITDTNADVYGRTVVRITEMNESIRIIRYCINNLPDGPLLARVPRRVPAGEIITRVEAPRGEDLHYMRSNGTDKPDRIRVRAPSEANWHGMQHMLEGGYLADVPITIAAIDPCYSCTDRAIVITSEKDTRITDWNSLRKYSIEWYKKQGLDTASLKI